MRTFTQARGFTLIEILVSVAIFTVVMVMALGALLAISAADRKAESLKSAINNLNFALDSMSRDIRTGYNWGCNASPGTNCQNPGANEFTYQSASFGYVRYEYDTSATDCGQTGSVVGCIVRATSPDNVTWSAWYPITAPEVLITGVSSCALNQPCLFYVVGAPSGGSGDTVQPKLVITLSGYVQVSATQTTPLHLQTTVTQRIYDQ